MQNKNKISIINTDKLALKDDFLTHFPDSDYFGIWRLLSYTKDSISRIRDYEMSEIGMTPEQSAILQILNRRTGKASIREVAVGLMRRENSVLTMVRRMEKLGLVDIIKHQRRKELEVGMTDKGRELYGKITFQSIEIIFAVLSAEERQKLSLYLRLLLSRTHNLLEQVEE
jgi:DNA-binding MarR family transcriptional regulator